MLLIGKQASLEKRCGLTSCHGNRRTADVFLVMGTDAEEPASVLSKAPVCPCEVDTRVDVDCVVFSHQCT